MQEVKKRCATHAALNHAVQVLAQPQNLFRHLLRLLVDHDGVGVDLGGGAIQNVVVILARHHGRLQRAGAALQDGRSHGPVLVHVEVIVVGVEAAVATVSGEVLVVLGVYVGRVMQASVGGHGVARFCRDETERDLQAGFSARAALLLRATRSTMVDRGWVPSCRACGRT